jgi:glycosyltransferase involved in cell wall biosynthesis
MIFKFLKYLQPTWYFNLPPVKAYEYFPKQERIMNTGVEMTEDSEYLSEEARGRDLAYRAFHGGYISKERSVNMGLNIWETCVLPLQDEYRFLRKNFHRLWVWYVLLIRLLSFKNPLREVDAFFRTLRVKRQNHLSLFNEEKYRAFESVLISEKPLVSVIIPTLNRYNYLKDVLEDLEQQTYQYFEVLVIDQSEPYDSKFYDQFNLTIRLIRQEEKALWLARNEGIRRAKGEIVAFSEDDVRINPHWLEEHLKCLDFWKSDISCGVFYASGTRIPSNRSFFKYAEQFATGNACLYRSVFEATGLFDRAFEGQRMGDGEFGLRSYLAGFLSVSTPYASCEDVKAPTGGLRQMGSWDAFRPKSFWSPRPIPSVLYFYRKYFGAKATILSLLKNIPPSIIPYSFKRNKLFLLLGALLSSFLLPILIIQIFRSWRLATKKLVKKTPEAFSVKRN